MKNQPDNEFSEMTKKQASEYASKITYVTLMGSRTKISPGQISFSPMTYIPTPSEEDYAWGYLPRFFARKANDPSAPVIEVSQEQWKGPIRNSPFYIQVGLKWKITGPLKTEYSDDGILQEQGVQEFNKNQITTAYNKRGIKVYLPNLLEFYKPS